MLCVMWVFMTSYIYERDMIFLTDLKRVASFNYNLIQKSFGIKMSLVIHIFFK